MPRGAALAGVLVGLLAGPLAAASGAATRSPKHHTIRCQHLRGHTILRRGSVRVFTASGTVYGCLAGRKLAWGLWESEHNLTQARTGSVRQVAGRFLAFAESFNDQYGFSQSLEVADLGNGATYTVAMLAESEGTIGGNPPSPGPAPLEAFRLARNGRSLRLYDTFAPSAKPNFSAPPTGQVLDVIGFHHFERLLARSAPGVIEPGSLSYNGRTAAWTQNGVRRSARV
jgi:hypothetical protein